MGQPTSRKFSNLVQAELCGCDIVTVPPDILKKARSLWQKDLAELSLDTAEDVRRRRNRRRIPDFSSSLQQRSSVPVFGGAERVVQ